MSSEPSSQTSKGEEVKRNLILEYKGGFGLGDFIRGAANWYYFCQKYKVNFTIETHLAECFELEKSPSPSADKHKENETCQKTKIICGTSNKEINHVKALFKGKEAFCLHLVSNLVLPTFNEAETIKLNDYLKPSALLRDYLSQWQEQLKITPNSYHSIHLRCGDDFMGGHGIKDNRLKGGDLQECIENAINHCVKYNIEHNCDLPLVLHCDNLKIKKMLVDSYNLLSLPIKAVHTAGRATLEEKYLTVGEFYFMGYARQICSVVVNKEYFNGSTGFSYWSAKLHGKPNFKF